MFDYDKTLKKLKKMGDLSNKKQGKVLESIFCSSEFRDWFYSVGENANDQPMTKAMISNIIENLAKPKAMKRLTKFIRNKTTEDFDHTACSICYLVVEHAIDASNTANREITDEYKNGELPSKEAREYKNKSEKYSEYITELVDALKEKAKPEVKDVCKKTNLPKSLIYTTYFMLPGRKYIPKYKVGMYMNQLLQEIYKWTGKNGMEDVPAIRWGSYFGTYFGSEMASSAALSVLLEGVTRINMYRDLEHFDDVRKVWDSLTNFALTELDRAPENVRRQMIELYIKRIEKLFRNGNGPRLRVDILNIPNAFDHLSNTIAQYTNRISKITRANARQIEDFNDKYKLKKYYDASEDSTIKDVSNTIVNDFNDDHDSNESVFNFVNVDEDDD